MIPGLEARIAADSALAALLDESRARDAAATTPDPTHDTAHALRVAHWTIRLGGAEVGGEVEVGGVEVVGGETLDAREAIAAALLHDAVNPPKDSPERAVASAKSADLARERLASLGFAPEAIERVADAIRDHSFSRGAVPATPLGRALQDADRLEALGAIGLLRCISTGVRMGSAWFHAHDPWAEARPLDDGCYSIDHFFTKLLTLPATMRTEAGRLEAERRATFLREFVAHLGGELGRPAPLA